jgi:hypothetical protein
MERSPRIRNHAPIGRLGTQVQLPDWEVNSNEEGALSDTLRLRSSRYRMPFLGTVRVPVNAKPNCQPPRA